MTKFVNRNKLFRSSVRTKASALSADSIPKMDYIRTQGADMNELDAISPVWFISLIKE